MDWASERWQIEVGDGVYASEGAKLGEVVVLGRGYVVAEKGFVVPTDDVPTDAVADREDGRVP